jgi:hypothetical protein
VHMPEISAKLNGLGIVPGGQTKEEIAANFKREHDALAAAIKIVGIPTSD